MENIVWICSIDIGQKNFAFYIEEFDTNKIISQPNIPKIQRYNPDGTSTPQFANVIREICKNGSKILYENIDITNGCKKGIYLDPKVFYNMTQLLDIYGEYWSQCDSVLIEMQMSFGNKRNTIALKLAQHCWSYFSIKYPQMIILEFPAYHKTQVLGAQKNSKTTKKGTVKYEAMDKPSRKKWSVTKAMSILAERNDFDTMSELTSAKKKDDLADVLCQLQAYKILHYIDKSI